MVDGPLLVLAGVGAGLTGSIAGLASLVSYPALLIVGLTPVTANVTNTVALAFSTVASVGASAPELRGRTADALRLAVACGLGGAVGCALILLAPGKSFERVVPWLITVASLAVLLSGRGPAKASPRRPALAFVFAIGVYGGYFGAAAGVMMLAILVRHFAELPVASAVRNLVLGSANIVAATIFALVAPIQWHATLLLVPGLLLGGSLGPRIVRRTNPAALRACIAVAGLGLAACLFVKG